MSFSFRRIWLILVCVICVHSCAIAGQDIPQHILNMVANATVMVSVQTGDQAETEINWGSGMVIAPGLVVTNAHVVNEKGPAKITIHNHLLPPTTATVVAARYDSNEFETSNVVEYVANTLAEKTDLGVRPASSQRNYDIAVLSFAPTFGAGLPSLAIAQAAYRGERVIVSGYPGGDQAAFPLQPGGFSSVPSAPLAFSSGTVSGVMDKSPQIIVHSAQCSTGNSGGPVVNDRGEVIGMQTWTSVPGSSAGYMSLAIGGRDIAAFLERHGIRPKIAGYRSPSTAVEPATDARPLLLARAGRGDPDAEAMAGLFYFLGKYGFEKNDRLAVQYLQNAVNRAPGRANSYLYKAGLAAVLLQSPGVWQPDYAEGLLRAANRSDYLSDASSHPDLHLLAYEAAIRMQGKALGIQEDPNRSLQLAEKALTGGFALPFAIAGYHYYFGDAYAGRDHGKALRYARQAASNNIPEGISLLAHLYYDSDVIPRTSENLRIARKLAEEAAGLGDPWAYGLLANMYYESGAWDSKVKALKLALLGTCFGNRLAVYCLGRLAWDRWLASPGDVNQAVRAWAYADWAERRGVRTSGRTGYFPGTGGGEMGMPGGGGLRSSGDVMAYFSGYPGGRERILAEGRREQDMLEAKRRSRPRIPAPESVRF